MLTIFSKLFTEFCLELLKMTKLLLSLIFSAEYYHIPGGVGSSERESFTNNRKSLLYQPDALSLSQLTPLKH